jgi:ADP-ribosylglycohydrolase
VIGSIIGDIVGSVYEWNRVKTTEFELFAAGSDFTDDSVLTIAIADSILRKADYGSLLLDYGRSYPGRGYGAGFKQWLNAVHQVPYDSFGNGSAMRASPIGFAFGSIDDVLHEAAKSAEPTHNHPEGIKGAQATAAAVFYARMGATKSEIRDQIALRFGYDLHRRVDEIRPSYRFDETCQGTVPEAIIAFLESHDYESAIRNAIYLGGDSDTIACITGGIAQAFYRRIPAMFVKKATVILPKQMLTVIHRFERRYGIKYN